LIKVKKAYQGFTIMKMPLIEDHYFSSCGHLDITGAEKFKIILNDFLGSND
jgi:hypothetical protein